ncbi:MAG: tRNA uridine-5-carboxymethylaminomethyl(34) synthesis GTPase MnmE [Clostridia bacterium]|nr:tRNA uridine-5-carboxymethylaminomethyl(34) synthesis GTPase MnmE [Clostridia bacterium]
MIENTIVAISTAVGNGGIGIIRMSGEKCFKILEKIFIPKNKQKRIKGYTIKYGNIVEDNNIIDEVLVSYFIAPNSYTTENMCEINTHGGIVVERKILNLCLKHGAELAQPGEFTKRAFLNGRIDLSQAEAVMELINSKSELEAQESALQLEGALSKKIKKIEKKLLNVITSIEVTIDYPEYDIDEVKDNDILSELKDVNEELENLINSFNNGRLLKNGVKTVILGRPNVGKSSLMNSILNEDRAIVSSIEGTTRDTIEEYVNVFGIELKLVDTAGIRSTDNEIEKIGVEKAKNYADNADLIIALFDITKDLNEEDYEIISIIKEKAALILLNKVDITDKNEKMEASLKKVRKPIIKISAIKNEGIDKLYSKIVELFNFEEIERESKVIITNERHKNLIVKANNCVLDAIKSYENNIPIDISSVYIKQSLEFLGEIMGQNISNEIINEIFKNFCLGK